MKKLAWLLLIILLSAFPLMLSGCTAAPTTSDDTQREQQETLLKEATAQTGMPAIKNFRERKILKDILELRDQEGLITYTYLENEYPKITPGKTALAGKLTFLGVTVGYGIPYATQYTNPQKVQYTNRLSEAGYAYLTLPQADPNGLFSPASAEGTWVLMKDPKGDKTLPVYVEPRIVVLPFKLPTD